MFYKQLHGLRGVASLLVFIAHITAGYGIHIDDFLGNHTQIGTIQFFITNIGTFGVEIFFFLSGFFIFISSVNEEKITFFSRRFFRLYPLFFCLSILYILGIFFGFETSNIHNFQIIDIIYALLFINVFFDTPSLTPNSWSIAYEIWYYFCTYYLVDFIIKKRPNYFGFLIAVCILFWFVIQKPITIYFLLGAIVAFNLNFFKYLIDYFNFYLINFISLSALFYLLYLVSIGIEFRGNGWFKTIGYFDLALPFLLSIFFVSLLSKSNILNVFLSTKILAFFGTISYSLYLLHPYTYLFVRKLIEIFHFDTNFFTFILFLLFTSIFTFFISFFSYKYFEVMIYKYFTNKKIYD